MIATRLGKFAEEVETQMSLTEFYSWNALLHLEAEEMKKAQQKNKRK
jgi:hypothetical protein